VGVRRLDDGAGERKKSDSPAAMRFGSLLVIINISQDKGATLWLYGGLEIGYQRGQTRHALAAFGADTA
jgi:hypothetical protein